MFVKTKLTSVCMYMYMLHIYIYVYKCVHSQIYHFKLYAFSDPFFLLILLIITYISRTSSY